MSDFKRPCTDSTVTLEQYKAMEEAGLITRPISWGPIRRRTRRTDETETPTIDLTTMVEHMNQKDTQ